MKTDIKIFAVHNDTNLWAIICDGRIGLFGGRDDAQAIWRAIGGSRVQSDELADTPFGSAQMLPPHHACSGCRHVDHSLLSDYAEFANTDDLQRYVDDQWASWNIPQPDNLTCDTCESIFSDFF